jgi:hypothetical protein
MGVIWPEGRVRPHKQARHGNVGLTLGLGEASTGALALSSQPEHQGIGSARGVRVTKDQFIERILEGFPGVVSPIPLTVMLMSPE